jgi:acyl carrier protein
MQDIKQGSEKNHDPKTYNTVCSEIITIINEKVEVIDHIGEHSSLITDMDLDSVELVELITKFENKFGVEIPIDRLPELKTIKDLAKLIFSLIHKNHMRQSA